MQLSDLISVCGARDEWLEIVTAERGVRDVRSIDPCYVVPNVQPVGDQYYSDTLS